MKNVFFIIPVLFIGCLSSIEEKKVYNDEGQLVEIQKFSRKSGQPEGLWLKYYPNGTVYEEALYQNGVLDGPRKLYDSLGNVEIIEHYHKGEYEGEYLRYYADGTLKIEGNYQQNQMAGVWKVYYANGLLKESVHYEKNLENGPFEEYYENGNMKARGTYLEGEHEHGKLELFSKSGQIERIMECDKGMCQTVWRSDNAEQKG
jgi:antitoxin component YwqK of YwqJK toxin-antitoxin module